MDLALSPSATEGHSMALPATKGGLVLCTSRQGDYPGRCCTRDRAGIVEMCSFLRSIYDRTPPRAGRGASLSPAGHLSTPGPLTLWLSAGPSCLGPGRPLGTLPFRVSCRKIQFAPLRGHCHSREAHCVQGVINYRPFRVFCQCGLATEGCVIADPGNACVVLAHPHDRGQVGHQFGYELRCLSSTGGYIYIAKH